MLDLGTCDRLLSLDCPNRQARKDSLNLLYISSYTCSQARLCKTTSNDNKWNSCHCHRSLRRQLGPPETHIARNLKNRLLYGPLLRVAYLSSIMTKADNSLLATG